MRNPLEVMVEGIWRQGEGNLAVRLAAPDGAPLPEWSPGAHIDVHLPGGRVRQYSLTGNPASRRGYLICVARAPDSRGGSRYIHEALRPGQRLTISAPRNLFPLEKADRVVLMAAGIGITPLYAMVRRLEDAGVPFTLHYYVRRPEQAAFRYQLGHPFRFGDCTIYHSSAGESPRHALPEALTRPATGTRLYLCGPDGFMDHVRQSALTRGWSPENIHSEAFQLPAPSAPASSDNAFTVTLASTGQRWPVAADQTIARVLLDNGIDVPLSCEMGICGACLTPVTEGTVDHRDSVQSAAEKSGPRQQVALCCSRSLTENLTISLAP
jgi:ferredoxin-NADP reductase